MVQSVRNQRLFMPTPPPPTIPLPSVLLVGSVKPRGASALSIRPERQPRSPRTYQPPPSQSATGTTGTASGGGSPGISAAFANPLNITADAAAIPNPVKRTIRLTLTLQRGRRWRRVYIARRRRREVAARPAECQHEVVGLNVFELVGHGIAAADAIDRVAKPTE